MYSELRLRLYYHATCRCIPGIKELTWLDINESRSQDSFWRANVNLEISKLLLLSPTFGHSMPALIKNVKPISPFHLYSTICGKVTHYIADYMNICWSVSYIPVCM